MYLSQHGAPSEQVERVCTLGTVPHLIRDEVFLILHNILQHPPECAWMLQSEDPTVLNADVDQADGVRSLLLCNKPTTSALSRGSLT